MEIEVDMKNFNIVRYGGILKNLIVKTSFGMWFPYTKHAILDYKTMVLDYKN